MLFSLAQFVLLFHNSNVTSIYDTVNNTGIYVFQIYMSWQCNFYANNVTGKICSLIICCANFHRVNFELHFQSPSLLEVKTFSLQKCSFVWIASLFHYEPTKIALSYIYKTKNSNLVNRICKIFFYSLFLEWQHRMSRFFVKMIKWSKIAIQSCAVYWIWQKYFSKIVIVYQ